MTEDAQTEAACGVQTADLCTLPPKHQNIILIGMPAVGKTTIGKRIAAAADLTFLDTDRIIEAETGKKIPDLLRENGTDGFLAIENRSKYAERDCCKMKVLQQSLCFMSVSFHLWKR